MHVRGFAKKIWKQFGRTLDKRAQYLKRIADLSKNESTFRYLDIGSGAGENALCFGHGLKEIHCLDIKISEKLRKKVGNNVFLYTGDAHALPFKDKSFGLVSMISVIEHLSNKLLAIREANRVLKKGGAIVIQVPNRYFPFELHTGLPFLYYVHHHFRRWILRSMGYEQFAEVEIPSKSYLIDAINSVDNYTIRISKVIYPPDLILPSLRFIYSLLKSLRLFDVMPLGWLFVCTKQ